MRREGLEVLKMVGNFYARLEHATEIKRDADGTAWTWRSGELIETFTSPSKFAEYIEDNIADLQDAAVFTGSAFMVVRLNAYLAGELKKAGVL